MDFTIRYRVLQEAEIFLKNKSTVREVAKKMGYSKSTVHKDFIEKLKYIDEEKWIEVRKLLEHNRNVRHIRGGEATKQRFMKLKNEG